MIRSIVLRLQRRDDRHAEIFRRGRNVPIPMRGLPVAVLAFALCACTEQPGLAQPANENPKPFADSEVTEAVMGKWSRSCALCHVTGEGGAPRIGNAAEWQPRLAQGEATLLAHTIDGFNNMPPLGYCMACERDDLRALINLMVGDAR